MEKESILESILKNIIDSYYDRKSVSIIDKNIDIFSLFINDLAEYYKRYPKWLYLNDLKSEEIVVVGDIHGDFDALLKIIKIKLSHPHLNLIFLGDFIDRGSNSNEVILSVIILNLLFLNTVFILPGNHELFNYFRYQNADFWNQDGKITLLYNPLINLIEYLPLIINVDNSIMTLHGGFFGYDSKSEDDNNFISNLKYKKGLSLRELIKKDSEKIFEIVWADYLEKKEEAFFSSLLGRPVKLNQDILKLFNDYQIKLIFRGHQPSMKGITFDGRVITLLTSSIYSNMGKLPGRLIAHITNKHTNRGNNLFNNLNTNTDTNRDKNIVTKIDTKIDTNIDTNIDTIIDTNIDTNTNTNLDNYLDTKMAGKVEDNLFNKNVKNAILNSFYIDNKIISLIDLNLI